MLAHYEAAGGYAAAFTRREHQLDWVRTVGISQHDPRFLVANIDRSPWPRPARLLDPGAGVPERRLDRAGGQFRMERRLYSIHDQGALMANPNLVEITSENWDKEVKYGTLPVMVDFYSPT
jgi:hypothetical protein